jgi:solute carrier family 35, member E1
VIHSSTNVCKSLYCVSYGIVSSYGCIWLFVSSYIDSIISGSSAIGNVIVKELLEEFPFPFTITLAQLLSIWILIVPLIRFVNFPLLFDKRLTRWLVNLLVHFDFHRIWKIPQAEYLHQNRIYYFKLIIPLAIGKFLAQLSSHVSLWKVTISYTHTIKATMPLFTV